MSYFQEMIPHSLAYAQEKRASGQKVVGIMCEYTPREMIMAAEGIPVCLCGGDLETISPAEERLPSNLCPLIKSTYGYHVQKSNPFLEMMDLIVAETTCDGKKKMYELLAEERPVYILELPQKESDEDAFAHWLREMEKLKIRLQKEFDVEITDKKIGDAIRVMNRERALRRKLAEFMTRDEPPLTGRELLDLKSIISGIPADFDKYEECLKFLDQRKPEPSLGSRVRVLLTGVPIVHGAERVVDLIEDNGGLVVCMENCTGLKPILDDVDENDPNPTHALAKKYFKLPCSVLTRNNARIDSLQRLAKDYRPDCIIDLIWQTCLTYDVESYRVKRLAEEELGIPYLHIETDYSPSDSARLAVRIEALFETVREGRR